MPDHHQTLARLDLLVAEARDLCARARDVHLGEAARDVHPGKAAPDADAAVALAFQTVLARQVRDWMHRAETMVRTVKQTGDTVCGARAGDLRRLIDAANVATLRRSDRGEAWTAFSRSTREIKVSVATPASTAPRQ